MRVNNTFVYHSCNFRTFFLILKVQMWEKSSRWRVSLFSALWHIKGAEELISLAANISEGNILESWFLEGKRKRVERSDKNPWIAHSVKTQGAQQASLALTSPTHLEPRFQHSLGSARPQTPPSLTPFMGWGQPLGLPALAAPWYHHVASTSACCRWAMGEQTCSFQTLFSYFTKHKTCPGNTFRADYLPRYSVTCNKKTV